MAVNVQQLEWEAEFADRTGKIWPAMANLVRELDYDRTKKSAPPSETNEAGRL
jgi:hypothetical protein